MVRYWWVLAGALAAVAGIVILRLSAAPTIVGYGVLAAGIAALLYGASLFLIRSPRTRPQPDLPYSRLLQRSVRTDTGAGRDAERRAIIGRLNLKLATLAGGHDVEVWGRESEGQRLVPIEATFWRGGGLIDTDEAFTSGRGRAHGTSDGDRAPPRYEDLHFSAAQIRRRIPSLALADLLASLSLGART